MCGRRMRSKPARRAAPATDCLFESRSGTPEDEVGAYPTPRSGSCAGAHAVTVRAGSGVALGKALGHCLELVDAALRLGDGRGVEHRANCVLVLGEFDRGGAGQSETGILLRREPEWDALRSPSPRMHWATRSAAQWVRAGRARARGTSPVCSRGRANVALRGARPSPPAMGRGGRPVARGALRGRRARAPRGPVGRAHFEGRPACGRHA